MSYTKLFQSIVTSSIWTQDDHTRIVWITMLALANQHGEVQASIPGLARVSGVSIEAAEKAINHFLAPDAYSRTKDDDGRRIEAIDGGWALLNHAKYRAMASKEESKEASAVRQRRFRERAERNGSNGSVTPSNAHVTPSNGPVTPRRDIAEAEAEAEADSKEPLASVASLPAPKKGFQKPTVEELALQCAKIGLPETEADKFWNFYESKGWRVGTSPMRSWQAAMVTWRGRWQERNQTLPLTSQGGGLAPWRRVEDLKAELKQLDGLLHDHMDRERLPEKVARREVVRAELTKLKANP